MSELILVVDDEQDLLNTLEYNLQRDGYETRTAATGAEALVAARAQPRPGLILLDLMLPDMSGMDVCRELRADASMKDVAILILTAKDEEIDRVVGFELGADDYVAKPFSVRELLLRVRAILRRARARDVDSPTGDEPIGFGALRIDPGAHRVWVDSTEVTLTALELKLLRLLLERRGRVQSRDRLLDEVWDIQADVTTRTVDTTVKRLRQKLGAAGEYVETVRGVGYRFAEQPA